MAARTVRLDDDTEKILQELVSRMGLSVSGVVKQGILALRDQIAVPSRRTSYDIFRELDLGPGGYASAPSTDTMRGAQSAIRRQPPH